MAERLSDIQDRERAALVAQLQELRPEQWRTPTLCSAWDVEEVVAHLTAAAGTSMAAWMRSMIRARFDADVHNRRLVESFRGATPQQTLDRFRAAGTIALPLANSPGGLGELIVHAEDIRRPLGLAHRVDTGGLLAVARFFATRDFAVNSKSLVQGLTLVATDADFRHGSGPAAEGPLIALVMAMAGRTAYLDELTGDGVRELAQRMGGNDRA
ncbi:maleylpyruvate isomerase family mycothiol-dependent enzyme [Aeromicrobium camelliae]|uniref:Maleylpyruvate isomerase family mycothiol-dependent enzyme n=1 Tax=Aeromicrobium camelliae TaxID=1538144 RepID=A0A3N6X5Z7_9ACTN|nr:maleylpyruvate isomerase family mycothiol-dependent enzyme [Aeromicrobium camelliae]RQN09063.1 maleylpyruvate isomerase family mycothiol-dependent enzyme [Aeromicrobium camelliae]